MIRSKGTALLNYESSLNNEIKNPTKKFGGVYAIALVPYNFPQQSWHIHGMTLKTGSLHAVTPSRVTPQQRNQIHFPLSSPDMYQRD
jgi:hypothetical protein